MKITEPDAFIPPRTIDSREAARRLETKTHLLIIGSAAVADHQAFIDELCRAIPGRLAALRVQIDRTPDAPHPRLVMSNARPGTAPEYDLILVPNDLAGRLGLSVLLLRVAGVPALAELDRKEAELAKNGTPVALMLDTPAGVPDDPTLERDCVFAVEFLRQLHAGGVTDTAAN